MVHQEGELLIGKVNEVKPYALFLIFDDGSRGLLHISELSDSYIRDIEKFGRKGDDIKVKVLSIDKSNGFLRVSYKQVPVEERFSTHNENARFTPSSNEKDFEPLKNRLDGWIKETLKKM